MSSRNARMMYVVTATVGLVLGSASVSAAQSDWLFQLASGPAPTVGEINDRLTGGWNIDFGAGYTKTSRVKLLGEFIYTDLGVSDQVLRDLRVPDGDARMWSLTAGPMWHFPVASRINGHVLGGIGFYRRTVEFREPTIGIVNVFDPWWGHLGPVLVPANQILGSVSRNAFGFNLGGGLSVPIANSGTEVFADIRYHHAYTDPSSTSTFPVSFGLRWSGRR